MRILMVGLDAAGKTTVSNIRTIALSLFSLHRVHLFARCGTPFLLLQAYSHHPSESCPFPIGPIQTQTGRSCYNHSYHR